jgi:putative transposase
VAGVPRPHRLQPAGGVFHITSRGNRRQEIFVDDADRELFLAILGEVVARYRWRCHAYCLMPNHYHLLIETTEENLSIGMHRLNFLHAMRFNHRHGFDGHLFQGRFHSVLVESNHHLIELTRYIVLNPVRGGLCTHPLEWRWSSFRAAVRKVRRPRFLTLDWVLAQFGDTSERACAAYQSFVEAARPP